jgi:hypothetical protein
MENSELCILIENKDLNTDLLAGFPYLPEQFYSHEEDNEVVDTNQTWLVIDLADRRDTTTAQEQWLNCKSQIIEYSVR